MKYASFILIMLLSATALGASGPFSVGTTPKETEWTNWGYVVDGQDWANWLSVPITWSATASDMSGSYIIEEDFLFQVDPSTSGLSDPSSVYGADFWNHDDVYGLGEFFDAGLGTNDQQYVLDLDLTANTWAVWYDADRDQVRDGGLEHDILGGTIDSYSNRDGYFYGILSDDDGAYDGYFNTSHNEGTPDLANSVFHVGTGDPVPEPATMLLLGLGGLLLRRKKA